MSYHVHYNPPVGAKEIWAFSTVPTNVRIRGELYAALGPVRARMGLSLVYPSGSAVEDVEKALERRAANVADFDAASAIMEVCAEIVAKVAATVEQIEAGFPDREPYRHSSLIAWFEALPAERQAVLKEDRWLLAEAAFAAARL
jgi:hypothetical protein